MPAAPHHVKHQKVDISDKTYQAVDALLQRSKRPADKELPILVATVVDLDDFSKSSPLGRLLGEYISGRLVQQGYYIGETRLRGTLAIKKQEGEMILSRDLAKLTKEYNAQAVVAGTYAEGGTNIHINLRFIEATSGQILSSVDYSLPIDRDINTLIANK